jgi:hypothetical protein
MSIETARSFFLWCSVINYAVLLLWVALALFGRDGVLRLWSRGFRISPEQFDMINIGGITLYKTGIILFNLVPCIALYVVK